MSDPLLMIWAFALAGVLSGMVFALLALCPQLRANASAARAFEAERDVALMQLAAQRAVADRYSAALARVAAGMSCAAPTPDEPFFFHRKAAFDRAAQAVLDACKDVG